MWNILGEGPLTNGIPQPVPAPRMELAFPVDGYVDDDGALSWQERALCAQTDPEAFFPEKGGSTREAKRVCVSCEVRVECLEYALEHDERFGIWGGLSERERRKLKRRAI
ncbi:WhiB family transcriptional regulator [Occultella glacieicola]|nr:WhiB family transcriptional regulator [Occultella glacieicola]